MRENNRLSKVVQSLQVECSLQRASIEELSRKCKIQVQIIHTLQQEEQAGIGKRMQAGQGAIDTPAMSATTQFIPEHGETEDVCVLIHS